MIYTTKYSLAKPEENDTVDITVLNQNMDKIDTELKSLSTEKASISEVANHSADTTKHITTAERTSWNGKADGMTYSNGQLQLKAGSNNVGLPVNITTGGTINAFSSGINNFSYKASVNGQATFKIPITYVTTDIVTLYRANLTLIRGVDYSVGNDGTVTLVDALALGDIVYGDLKHTSFDANDLLHKEIFAAADHTHAPAIPFGVITMWSGAATAIPTGWALCNGANGTPDLRDRFIVGAGGSYAVGNTGGAASVALTEAQMPRHRHGIADWRVTGSISGKDVYCESLNGSFGYGSPDMIEYKGNSEPFENRPPYYALCFIMFKGA